METSWLLDVPMCHLHPKPLLSCKFCRKYKTAVHQQAKLAQLHERAGFGQEKTNTLEMTNTTSYNLNPMLKENILVSEYYKSLYQFTTVRELIEEVVQYVDHVEPHVTGHLKIPSTFACCLYKLFNLRCTEDEMLTITEHPNLFVRTLGFVWLRFVHPPEKLWQWFETVVLDDTEFRPTKSQITTFGEFAESLLKEDRYFNTPLPRLPAKIRTQYSLQLQPLPKHRWRKQKNLNQLKRFRPGSTEVFACFKGSWMPGTFVEFYQDETLSKPLAMVKFDDGDDVPIDLGLVIIPNHRRRKTDRFFQTENLEARNECD